ncbi:MAG: SapC family protein [Sphingomonadales bacterium]|nr:SapC family protein [Sphingomonadales bacterium]MBD3774433.1 SapC family protein [Paracoccaceae bacterium]
MASAPQSNLPLFYNDLMPLNSRDHASWKARSVEAAPWLSNQHAIPVTADEFLDAQRHYPIVFSSGDNTVPLVLMGLNEGVNTFVDAEGKISEPVYVPAYVRRYPFLLAKLRPDSDELSLCFDPSCELIGDFEDGAALFEADGQPAEAVQGMLEFCQRFEEAGMRTQSFIDELKKHDLLMDGEVAISQNVNGDKPYIYRGFQMINEEKLRDVRGDVLRSWNQNGMLALIYAHLFSLSQMRVIFGRQAEQGKVPEQLA